MPVVACHCCGIYRQSVSWIIRVIGFCLFWRPWCVPLGSCGVDAWCMSDGCAVDAQCERGQRVVRSVFPSVAAYFLFCWTGISRYRWDMSGGVLLIVLLTDRAGAVRVFWFVDIDFFRVILFCCTAIFVSRLNRRVYRRIGFLTMCARRSSVCSMSMRSGSSSSSVEVRRRPFRCAGTGRSGFGFLSMRADVDFFDSIMASSSGSVDSSLTLQVGETGRCGCSQAFTVACVLYIPGKSGYIGFDVQAEEQALQLTATLISVNDIWSACRRIIVRTGRVHPLFQQKLLAGSASGGKISSQSN